jgi:hypothetical protein
LCIHIAVNHVAVCADWNIHFAKQYEQRNGLCDAKLKRPLLFGGIRHLVQLHVHFVPQRNNKQKIGVAFDLHLVFVDHVHQFPNFIRGYFLHTNLAPLLVQLYLHRVVKILNRFKIRHPICLSHGKYGPKKLYLHEQKKTKLMKAAITLIVTLFISVNVFGWGATGHRTIGEIAERHLSEKARAAIMKLLNNESLASTSTYMDDVKSDDAYREYYNWHFVTIPTGSTYEESEKSEKGDVIAAIEKLTADLKSGKLTDEEKAFAIKALVHFVGDVHQPLHVGKPGDRGGNDETCLWHHDPSNIHRVWDSDMINTFDMSYTELADNLVREAKMEDIATWQKSNVRDWAHESMTFRDQIYDFGNRKLGYEYSYDNLESVKLRLSQGGYRLAALFNEIFG